MARKAGAEMAPALQSLAEAGQAIAAALGSEDMFRLWDDPLAPDRLQRARAHLEDLRKARLAAEDAQERIERACELSGDSYSVPSLLLGREAGGLRRDEIHLRGGDRGRLQQAGSWRRRAPMFPSGSDRQASARNHGRIGDLMDLITELREQYRQAWKQEYMPYRLGAALGRFDGEYEYWRRCRRASGKCKGPSKKAAHRPTGVAPALRYVQAGSGARVQSRATPRPSGSSPAVR